MLKIKFISSIALSMFFSINSYGGQKPEKSLPIMVGKDIAIVQTEYGKVRGYIHNGTYIYKGIPYAKAERFMPPVKPDKWKGIRNSLVYGPVCPLMKPTTSVIDVVEFPFNHDWGYPNENCLVLNIWTQGINDNKKRPVMVWLHGGGFTAGSSQELPSYDGENISKKGDIVLVSVNHRLNVLGFTDLSAFGKKYKSSGNVGIMDLVAALKWVKGNIANFGGDPGNVTIFGQSGGGGKVIALMNAPSAKGLFHKAIIESGAISSFQDQKISRRVGKAVVSELGIDKSEIDKIQKVPYPELVAATERAIKKVREELKKEGKPVPGFGLGMSPVIDGKFLPYKPTDPRALKLGSNIPIIVGTTKNEFMPSSRMNPPLTDAPLKDVMVFINKKYGDRTEAYLAAVKKAYPNDTRPSDLIDIDTMFRRMTIKYANEKAKNSKAPVYMYLFTWQSPVFNGNYKAMHCMELPFVFDNIARCEQMTGGGRNAYILADKMSQAWINFARTGDPNDPSHKGLPKWEHYTAKNGATMIFDNKCVMKYHHDRDLLKITAGQSGIF